MDSTEKRTRKALRREREWRMRRAQFLIRAGRTAELKAEGHPLELRGHPPYTPCTGLRLRRFNNRIPIPGSAGMNQQQFGP